MDELSYIMKNRKEFMRAKAYSNARDSIANFKGTIQGPNDVKGVCRYWQSDPGKNRDFH